MRKQAFSPLALAVTAIVLLFSLPLVFWNCNEGSTGPAGPPGSGGNLQDPAIMPEVISTYPADHTTGPFPLFAPGDDQYNPNFVVQFNKLINLNEVNPGAVTVQGFDRPVRVTLLSGYYPYPVLHKASGGPFDDILAFSIYDSLSYYSRSLYAVGALYTVTLDTSIVDINGHHLAQPFSFLFRPEPYVRVTTFSPSDKATLVQISAPIEISFNTRIDATVFSSLHTSPSLIGNWAISSYDSASAFLSYLGPLPFNSTYSISVDAGAPDARGDRTTTAYSSSFTTTAFRVVDTYPDPGQTQIPPNSSINASFSGSADTASIRAAFGISPPVPGRLTPSYLGGGFYFAPFEGLAPATQYTVTITTALHATDGTPLQSPFSFSFTTAPFSVSYTVPQDGQFGVDRGSPVEVSFNSAIDTASARAAFSITPAIDGQLSAYGGGPIIFTHSNLFAPNTIYTVTLTASLMDVRGNHLPSQYTFSFRTAPE